MLLLLSYGADVNAMADARHDYRTVLHYAILGGDPTVINLFLKQGATLDLGPEYQKPTALDLAILKGDPSIVEMLLQAGIWHLAFNSISLFLHIALSLISIVGNFDVEIFGKFDKSIEQI